MRLSLLPVSFAVALLLGACATDPAIKEGEARNRQIAAGTWRLSELRLACIGNPQAGLPGRALTATEAEEQRSIVAQISALEPVIWSQVPLSQPRVEEFRRICAGDPTTNIPGRPLTAEERVELLTLMGAVIAGAGGQPGISSAPDVTFAPPSTGVPGGTAGADGTIIWNDGGSWAPDAERYRAPDQFQYDRYDGRNAYELDRWRRDQERRRQEWLWQLERQRLRDAYEWRLKEERRRRKEAERRNDYQDRYSNPPPAIYRPDPNPPYQGRPGTPRPPVNDDAARRAAEQASDRLEQQRREAERDLQRQTEQLRANGEASQRRQEAEQERAAQQDRINAEAEEARRRLDQSRQEVEAEARRQADQSRDAGQDRAAAQADEARRRLEQSRQEVEAEARRQAEQSRAAEQAEDTRRRMEQSRQDAEDQARRQAEQSRAQEDRQRQQEEAAQRQAAEQDRQERQAEDARRRTEQARDAAEAEARQQAEQSRRALDEARRQAQEEEQRQRTARQPEAPERIE